VDLCLLDAIGSIGKFLLGDADILATLLSNLKIFHGQILLLQSNVALADVRNRKKLREKLQIRKISTPKVSTLC
jgi:hypothetical protein